MSGVSLRKQRRAVRGGALVGAGSHGSFTALRRREERHAVHCVARALVRVGRRSVRGAERDAVSRCSRGAASDAV